MNHILEGWKERVLENLKKEINDDDDPIMKALTSGLFGNLEEKKKEYMKEIENVIETVKKVVKCDD